MKIYSDKRVRIELENAEEIRRLAVLIDCGIFYGKHTFTDATLTLGKNVYDELVKFYCEN